MSDYWQVGDEVYNFNICEKGVVTEVNLERIFVRFPSFLAPYRLDGRILDTSEKIPAVFHIKALTLDEQDRPITINYNYTPKRNPKVLVTKLPHEFVENEEVLIRDCSSDEWLKSLFSDFFNINGYAARPYRCFNNTLKTQIFGWKYCIPFKGNEHLEGKVTNCESGKVPDDYVFPKEEHKLKPFDRVLVRDFAHRPWKIDLFQLQDKENGLYSYECLSTKWRQCIPFEGNEKLLGTTNSPEE